MRGYSDTNVFTRDEKELLSCAQRLMEVIEDDPNLRCHEVARAIGQVLDLPHQDGAYGFVEHTWLWTSPPRALENGLPLGWMMPNILDVYCVGSLPLVRLVYMVTSGTGHVQLYRPGAVRTDIDHARVEQLIARLRRARLDGLLDYLKVRTR